METKYLEEVSGSMKRREQGMSRFSDGSSPLLVMSTATSYVNQEPGKSNNDDDNYSEKAILLYAYHMHYARQYDQQWRRFCVFLMHMYLKTVGSSSTCDAMPFRYELEESRLNLLPDDVLHIILEYFDAQMLCSFSMTSKIYQTLCLREEYWKMLLNLVFNVDTDCYVMKASSKKDKNKNCKICKNARDHCNAYHDDNDDQNDNNDDISSPSMKEIYKNTHNTIRNLLFQKSTENLSSNIFNSPMIFPRNVRLFA